jgi:hypothetical protein
MYLTRDEAVARLVSKNCTEANANANAILDGALALYPQVARTNFYMITGYARGTIMDAFYPGNPGISCDLFTISNW